MCPFRYFKLKNPQHSRCCPDTYPILQRTTRYIRTCNTQHSRLFTFTSYPIPCSSFTTPFMKSVPFESSTVSTPGSGVLCPPNPPPTPQGGVGGVPVPPPPPPTLPGAGSSQTHLKRVNWEKVHSTEGTIWREVGAAWKEEIELYIINKC